MLVEKRIQVWITGDATESTQTRFGDYGDLFENLLAAAGERWSKLDVRDSDPVPELDAVEAVVITGSSSTAHEHEPWIQRLNRAVSRAVDRQIGVCGVCFGHQVLANALGGESQRNPAGWEVGTPDLRARPGIGGNWNQAPRLIQVHRDHVVKAPPGAKVLLTSDRTPVQAFSLGDRVIGIQGHPEFDLEILDDLVGRRIASGTMGAGEARQLEAAIDPLPADRGFWRREIRRALDLNLHRGPQVR